MNKNKDLKHYSVMLQEVLSFLDPKPGNVIIDGTFGAGGHTTALLEKEAKVIGIDRDPQDGILAESLLKQYPSTFTFKNLKFSHIDKIFDEQNTSNITADMIDGVLWDFGLCTLQLTSDRGFSFYSDSFLDMGMGLNEKTAALILNTYTESKLADIFFYYSDEKKAKTYARKIVEARIKKPFQTVFDLLSIIHQVTPLNKGKINPATKVFQALRIEVNNEFQEIEETLQKALSFLKPNAKICCISFHSGEDRIVKNIFRTWHAQGKISSYSKKPLEPSEKEINENPASRSAKMRWAII